MRNLRDRQLGAATRMVDGDGFRMRCLYEASYLDCVDHENLLYVWTRVLVSYFVKPEGTVRVLAGWVWIMDRGSAYVRTDCRREQKLEE